MGIVRYIDYRNSRLPSLNLLEYIMHKDNRYDFECEVRVLGFPPAVGPDVEHFQANLFECEADPNIRVYAPRIDLTRLVIRVVVHPEAPAVYEEQVNKLCAAHSLPMPVRSFPSI
jgi:hypothetical protein